MMTRCRKIFSAIARKKTVDNKRLLETGLKRQLNVPDVLGIGKLSKIEYTFWFVCLSVCCVVVLIRIRPQHSQLKSERSIFFINYLSLDFFRALNLWDSQRHSFLVR